MTDLFVAKMLQKYGMGELIEAEKYPNTVLAKVDTEFGIMGRSSSLPAPWQRNVFEMNLYLECVSEEMETKTAEMLAIADRLNDPNLTVYENYVVAKRMRL